MNLEGEDLTKIVFMNCWYVMILITLTKFGNNSWHNIHGSIYQILRNVTDMFVEINHMSFANLKCPISRSTQQYFRDISQFTT